MLTLCYILCLDTCVRAFGGSLALTSAAVVYLTGSALGSLVPTPGGLGAVEAALSAGLTATGLAAATAVSAVLLFRLLTFWLPVPSAGSRSVTCAGARPCDPHPWLRTRSGYPP